MTRRGRHRLAASVLLAAMGTACGGGSGSNSTGSIAQQSGAHAPRRSTRPAPPKVIDRGRDPVGVARSLLLYGRWLEWHRLDASLVERAYQPGSALARVVTGEIATLQRGGNHLVEIDRAPLDLTIISRTPNVVSFRVTEHLERREIVDGDGRVVDRAASGTEHYVISMMRLFPDRPWRLNLVQRERRKIEVQL